MVLSALSRIVVPVIAFGESFDNHICLAFTLNEDRIIEGCLRIKHNIEGLNR